MRSTRNAIFLTVNILATVIFLIIVIPPFILSPPHIIYETPPAGVTTPILVDERQLLILRKDLPDCFDNPSWNVTGCSVDKLNLDRFDFKNHSIAGHALNGLSCLDFPRQSVVKHPPKVEGVGKVTFLLASKYFPEPENHHYHCAYYVTIHFSDKEHIWSEFIFLDECWSNDPKCERRYTVLLTNPRQGRPVAGLAYDSQEQMLYFLVSK